MAEDKAEIESFTTMAADFEASLPTLSAEARPKGQSEDYRFFTDQATGQLWKVRLVIQPTGPANVEASEEVAPSSIAVTVTASPVGEDGKALREDGKPIVSDSLTHVFNEVEMSAPDFDAKARIMLLVADRIKAGEARRVGVSAVNEIVGSWKKPTKKL